jgi:hypothetical protein
MPFSYNSIIIVIFLAFLFYLVIPGLGALTTLERWRKFRKNLLKISMYPIADYSHLAGTESGIKGEFRFFGVIESIHGENRIWIRNKSISIEADLTDVSLYFLPSQAVSEGDSIRSGEIFQKNVPVSAKWKRIFSLPEGTQVFVGGTLVSEGGHGVFKSKPKDPLLVVIYDGDERTILKRAIWCGRQKNEYWNQFTLISLITGFFSLVLLSYVFVRNPAMRFQALLSVNVSLLPLALFMPPGVVLYFLYRLCWNRSRLLRRERDMLRLPLRWFERKTFDAYKTHEIISLPDSSAYIMARMSYVTDRNFAVDRNRNIISCSVHDRMKSGDSVVFGTYEEKDGIERVGMPSDPMADCVEVEGDPEGLALMCHIRARWFAFLAAVLIGTDTAMNFVIIFFLLRYFLR